jgi:NAD+ synthase
MKVNIKETKKNLVNWIREWFSKNGNNETIAVLGISGGKDSTICAALLAEALGPDRVLGVLMPNNVQSDINDSKAVVEHLGIKSVIVNIGTTYNALTSEIEEKLENVGLSNELTAQYKTNTPSRLRMVTLYGVGAIIGNTRVCNTGNLSEAMIGYTTLYGDFAGDFALINKLTKSEVVQIGDELDLPSYLVHKAPGDGMSGKTDEDNIGFTYDELDAYIRNGVKGPKFELIDKKVKSMAFKRKVLNLPSFDQIVEE